MDSFNTANIDTFLQSCIDVNRFLLDVYSNRGTKGVACSGCGYVIRVWFDIVQYCFMFAEVAFFAARGKLYVSAIQVIMCFITIVL